ncbi:hypothetical protein GCM10011396_08580 [Undibacterium terreum]|uniref:Uncharacterized protein n=2 Tax=Undibacterium terreum TaxID=1224302 RepID=A0A916XCQ5_9BURK|nr:hypothetical protein GCM10011396_08580 [Undibacterium terreum]
MHYLAHFFAGAFLCNCIPHVACALQGSPFQTPFAKPRGVGNSSPLLNFLWGFFNFVVGLFLLAAFPIATALDPECLPLLLGAFAMGIYLSLHFGKVRQKP